uniref:ATP phosphoribosyltransferase regulatory subunit n=1 Tax=uncultured Fibrobacter sp. TaxID=261512 RepID=UPI00262C5AE6
GLSEDQVKKLDDFMSCKSIEEVKAKVHSENATAALQEIEDLFATLTAAGYGECVNLDLSIVRGLAYYTGIVFEVFDKGKSMRAIAGGGRYDSLTEKLGGERIPGVGFGMGDVVLADLLAEHKLLPSPKQSVDFYIASFTNDMKKVFETAQVFRSASSSKEGGKPFSVAHPLAAMKMGKQLDQANYQGAKIVVYVDGSKAAEGEFEYKDMRTGEMFVGNVAAIIDRL